MSINDYIKFLENIKLGFKIISWNKYRSETTTQSKNNNLDYLIDATFSNINRLFVVSFKNVDDEPTRNSFDEYYISLVEVKDFNALINNNFLISQLKSNKECMKNLSKCHKMMIIQQQIY